MASVSHHDIISDNDVCITGISGMFPNAKNFSEFEEKIYNKVDMNTTLTESKRYYTNYNIPPRLGIIDDIEFFDATFFGINQKQANMMDPQGRLAIEKCYEAIVDAGINPREMRGTKTAVFYGASCSEAELEISRSDTEKSPYLLLGTTRSLLANRISYALDLRGPSVFLDTACSTTLYALDVAYGAILRDSCDAAIVVCTNLAVNGRTTELFHSLGVLSPEAICRPFDDLGNGYVRSETISAILMQRAKDAKRIYLKVVHSRTNSDGYKAEGITYPSSIVQEKLLNSFYKEIDFDPEHISYYEAHATGTLVGDPVECEAIDNIICKRRKTPLLVGGVKGNVGHAECASGFASIGKLLLASERREIAPTNNYNSPRKAINALCENRMKVVDEITKLEGSFLSMSSFGFGGSNAHALFAVNPTFKDNLGIPADSLPRLVAWASRTKEGVEKMLHELSNKPLDNEFVALLHNIQRVEEPGFHYRGYGLFAANSDKNAICLDKSGSQNIEEKIPIIFLYSGMGSQWNGMGKSLMEIPLFQQSITKCHDVLVPLGEDLLSIITSDDPNVFDSVLNAFIGIAAIQIAITDILKELGISPDYIIGHSLGEVGCGYADDCLTLEETMLTSYYRGKASLCTKLIKGGMAAVGLGHNHLSTFIPSSIEIACHNSSSSSTISGPKEDIDDFVKTLKEQNIFAKAVNSAGIAYHSRYIKSLGDINLSYLKTVITSPKKRSSKWISSSVPKDQWNLPEHQFASASYFTNNLVGTVLFEEATEDLPKDGIMIEIGPHGLLQAIVKKSLSTLRHIPVTNRFHESNCNFFLGAVGKMYASGISVSLEKLYPEVKFPVTRGTGRISHLVSWRHEEKWSIPDLRLLKSDITCHRIVNIKLESDHSYMQGHDIDGRRLLPATGYLYLIWHQFCSFSNIGLYDHNIEFEEIRLMRATPLSTTKETTLDLLIFYGSGRFEISEKSMPIVTGFIRIMPDKSALTDLPSNTSGNTTLLTNDDFYKELRLRGYQYQDDFKSVMEASADGQSAKVKWADNWVSFMDCFLQLTILAEDSRSLYLPTRIRKINIFPKLHFASVPDGKESIVDVKVNAELGIIQAAGVEIHNVTANSVSRRNAPGTLIRDSYSFVAYESSTVLTTNDSIRVCTQLAFENGLSLKIRAMEIKSTSNEIIVETMLDVLIQTPQIAFELCLLTDDENLELTNISIINGKLAEHNNYSFIIASDCLMDENLLKQISQSLSNSGFVLCREKARYTEIVHNDFNFIACFQTATEYFVLLQKIEKKLMLRSKVVNVKSDDTHFKWIEEVNDFVKYGSVILLAQNDPLCGLLGLINCIRKEPKHKEVVLVHIDDPNAPEFDVDNEFYRRQLNLGLAVNIFKNGKWGSYRHLELKEEPTARPQSDHCYVVPQRKGDFSTLRFFNGPLLKNKVKNLAVVQYSSLNFRDVMMTSGKIPVLLNRLNEYNYIGFEYSGTNSKGQRIMGMSLPGCLGTHAEMIDDMTFLVPDSMSLKEAATIPVVYLTVYYAFFMYNIKMNGKSILIHAGSGGVGIAAITVALAYNMEVFTTVSTDEKKKFILERFPTVKESHIGNSRDCSFERMVKIVTKGKGVDFVLNSLSADKLKASIRCLGYNGVFLEIGKFDMANNSDIGLEPFLKELTFRSVMADRFVELERVDRLRIKNMLVNDLKKGIIKPLPSTVFDADEVEKAFRYLSTGKHMGKVLIQIRSDPFDKFSKSVKVLPKCYFNMDKVYIVVGGLGGFGMELCDWMILRGARKMVLVSRQGVTTGYQRHRIRLWQSYGCQVIVSANDVTTLKGCEAVFTESIKHGNIDGIFNLAAALHDGTMDTQTAQSFIECIAPKANATKYLDQLSRVHCPKLNHFVGFSSVACGHGNPGQANYGMANSMMERIIEKRVMDGLSGKAIQWGAIGEVGLIADMTKGRVDIEIAGTLPQTISSCLNELDSLLCTPEAIVKCMITAEKKLMSSKTSIIDSVIHIMGIRDLNSISQGASLSDLGMDSLTATEILQTLERDFNIIISLNELRTLTLAQLNELSKGQSRTSGIDANSGNESSDRLVNFKYIFNDAVENQDLLYRLPSLNNTDTYESCLVFLPGIDGVSKEWKELAAKTHIPTFIVNIKQNTKSIDEIIVLLSQEMRKVFANKKYFYFVGHSFGSLLAVELAKNLEAMNMKGHIISIDGSPSFAKKVCVESLQCDETDKYYEVKLILSVIREINPAEDLKAFAAKLTEYSTWEDKTACLFNYLKSINYPVVSTSVDIFNGVYKKMSGILSYTYSGPKIKSNITLLRAKSAALANISEKYDLDSYTDGEITVKYLDGSHLTIIQNVAIVDIIRECDPYNKT